MKKKIVFNLRIDGSSVNKGTSMKRQYLVFNGVDANNEWNENSWIKIFEIIFPIIFSNFFKIIYLLIDGANRNKQY